MVIKALSHSVQEVGKIVKKSKKRYVWKFMIDGYEHTVELRVSHISSKRKVVYNNEMIYEGKKKMSSSFQFPFQIDVNMCTVVEKGESYDLKINNLSFDQLEGGENFRNVNYNFDQPMNVPSSQKFETIDDQRRPTQSMPTYQTETYQQNSKPKKEIEHTEPEVKPQKGESKGFGFFKSKPKDAKTKTEKTSSPTLEQNHVEEDRKTTQTYRAPFQLNLDPNAASALRGVRHKNSHDNQENNGTQGNQFYNKSSNPQVSYTPSSATLYNKSKATKNDDEDSNYNQYGNNW